MALRLYILPRSGHGEAYLLEHIYRSWQAAQRTAMALLNDPSIAEVEYLDDSDARG